MVEPDTLFSIRARYFANRREMNGDPFACSKPLTLDPCTFWRGGIERVEIPEGNFFLAANGSGTYICDRTALIAEVTATPNANGDTIVRHANAPDEALVKFRKEVDKTGMYLLLSAAEGTLPKF